MVGLCLLLLLVGWGVGGVCWWVSEGVLCDCIVLWLMCIALRLRCVLSIFVGCVRTCCVSGAQWVFSFLLMWLSTFGWVGWLCFDTFSFSCLWVDGTRCLVGLMGVGILNWFLLLGLYDWTYTCVLAFHFVVGG